MYVIPAPIHATINSPQQNTLNCPAAGMFGRRRPATSDAATSIRSTEPIAMEIQCTDE